MSFAVSVLKNTNKVISSTEDNWSTIRPGSYIKIDNDNNIYTIAKTDKFFYIKDFECINSKTLLINDDVGIKLQNGDELKISYKEYKLDHIIDIKNGGKFYAVDDIIIVNDGEPTVDLQTGLSNPTKLIVKEVNEFGSVTQLSFLERGRYITSPNQLPIIIGGRGTDLAVELLYTQYDMRSIIEREIKQLIIKDNKTTIILNFPIPEGIKDGKLSTEKYEMTLTSEFFGESIKNANYSIHKDFTPNLKIPLLAKNSRSVDVIFNRAMEIIDRELNNLKNRK